MFSKQRARSNYSATRQRRQQIRALAGLLPRYYLGMRSFLPAGRRIAITCGLGLALVASQASAMFVVNQPWVRAAQRMQATEAYMDLTSTDGATLVGVVSDAAAAVAIRAPGKAASRVDRLPLPVQTVVALAPGGYRIVLSRLVRTLKLGDRVRLTLTIEAANGSRQDVGVDAEVRLRSPTDDEMRAHKLSH